uniref:Alpha-ketoglutarate-dependent dioxygenase AlkB-like domain-containing protein n=1 Tax=Mycena chlorophos TaxID=658473 RepID=A0ABQ0M8F0_MYCCL|nr:predicted protein [Mycena chlorophos]
MLRKFISTSSQLAERTNFSFHPSFFSLAEQRVLVNAALHKLDAMESGAHRRKRKAFIRASNYSPENTKTLQEMFLPDEYYEFHEGHYDGVINNYREMHLSSWPTSDFSDLPPILERLHALLPSQDTQTHLLHLASDGEIRPHVDNTAASGTWILGCSLGADRVLRMENEGGDDVFTLPLPSGSVYIQRDELRFNYKHSILLGDGGQRLSIMIRDRISASN